MYYTENYGTSIYESPSEGTLNGAPCQREQPQDRSLEFDGEYAREGHQGNFKISQLITHKLIVAAVTWLKYCRYGVKLYPIT